MSVTIPQEHDAAVFNEKCRKFDEADAAFRTLVDALNSYKQAVLSAADCGVAVAKAMDAFFTQPDHKQKQLVDNFLQSQLAIRANWITDAQHAFDAEVLAPIKSRLDEIPKVRETMRARASYKADMEKRQKRLQTDRKRDTSRLRDKQRRLKEITNQYTMFHNRVIQSFNYLERNMGTFVTGPLRALVTIMTQVSKSTVQSVHHVFSLVADTPPLTTEPSPAPPLATDDIGGIVGDEVWDDDFEDESDPDPEPDDDRNEQDNPEQHAFARVSSHLPPKSTQRVHSADAASKNSNSLSGVEPLGFEVLAISSPRRGHSPSSAPAELTRSISPAISLPAFSTTANGSHRDVSVGPSSISGRISQSGQESYLPPSSVASSTSTENVGHDSQRLSPNGAPSFRRRRHGDGKGSLDTVNSIDGATKSEVLLRVVAKYDFRPQESNELELRTGDVIEVTATTDRGWWLGQTGRAHGYFPRTYTRELNAEEELAYLNDKRRRRRRGHRRHDSQESRRSGQTASQSSVHVL